MRLMNSDDYIIDADYPIDLSRCSSKNEDGNLPLKKSSPRHTGELCPNSPNCPAAHQKIKVDNKARCRYQVGYWFRLIDASICGASAEGDTQFSIFDSSALKKQCLILERDAPSKAGGDYEGRAGYGGSRGLYNPMLWQFQL
jgi:hypothetical protein